MGSHHDSAKQPLPLQDLPPPPPEPPGGTPLYLSRTLMQRQQQQQVVTLYCLGGFHRRQFGAVAHVGYGRWC
jgi:hypothetical protein